MAIGRTNTGGGGGGLNFSVIGSSTVPSGAKENMIWVNTSTPITSWIFSATEPASPAEGMAWINIGTSSPVAFNAAKKNTVMIYPLSAVQYVSGEWVERTAKTFIGGEWVAWWITGTLFTNGTDDTELTGGWASFAYSAGSGYVDKTVGVEISSDGVCATLAGTGYHSTFIGTNNRIDVTDYSTIKFEFSEAKRTTASGAIKINLYSDAGYTIAASAYVVPVSGETNLSPEIDVSKLSGKYYIGYFMWTWDTCTLSAKMTLARLS